MRNVLSMLVLAAAGFWLTDAHAAYTRCDISYQTKSVALFLGEGGFGNGTARCWDVAHNEYLIKFDLLMGGPVLRVGYCETSASFSAQGPGFALNELLSGLGQLDLSPHMARGRGVAIGLRVNFLGLNVSAYGTRIRHEGVCPSLVGLIFQGSSSIGTPQRMGRRRPPPMPREYYEEDRRPRRDRRDDGRGRPGPLFDPDLDGDPVGMRN